MVNTDVNHEDRAEIYNLQMAKKTDLSQRITQLISHFGSKAKMAEAVGISRNAVSKWTDGTVKDLRMAHLFTLAEAAEVNPKWLATGEGPKKRDEVNSEQESKLLRRFNRLTPEMRADLVDLLALARMTGFTGDNEKRSDFQKMIAALLLGNRS